MKYQIVAILLTLTQYAQAISINFSNATIANNHVEGGIVGLSTPNALSSVGYSFNDAGSLSVSSWSYFNTPEQAVFGGSQAMLGSGSATGTIAFRINEPVAWSFEAGSRFALADGGSYTQSVFFSDPGFFHPVPPPVYTEFKTSDAEFGILQFASSGFLAPGRYDLYLGSYLDKGFSNGSFEFTLSRVPEAGSSLLLMSLGLGAIGIWRYRTV